MEKETLKKIIKKLEGLNYEFFAGLAIEIYTNGARQHKDIDILIAREEMEEAAKRFNSELERKDMIGKGDFQVYDYLTFETVIDGQEIEVVSDSKKMKFNNKIVELNQLTANDLKDAVKANYLGIEVNLQPIEEAIVQKALMNREKDKKDIKLLLKDYKIDKERLEKALKHWNVTKEELSLNF